MADRKPCIGKPCSCSGTWVMRISFMMWTQWKEQSGGRMCIKWLEELFSLRREVTELMLSWGSATVSDWHKTVLRPMFSGHSLSLFGMSHPSPTLLPIWAYISDLRVISDGAFSVKIFYYLILFPFPSLPLYSHPHFGRAKSHHSFSSQPIRLSLCVHACLSWHPESSWGQGDPYLIHLCNLSFE